MSEKTIRPATQRTLGEECGGAGRLGQVATLEHLAATDPLALASRVKEYVIGQDRAVEECCCIVRLMLLTCMMAMAGADARDLPEARAMLLVGSTGSGKTHMLRTIARELGIGHVIVDCASLTGTGWKGVNVGDALAPVARAQQEDPTAITLVMWDEADKLGYSSGSDHESFNAQKDILKILDGGERQLYEDKPNEGAVLDCDRLVHVFAGAFAGIEDSIAERFFEAPGVGFAAASAGLPVKPSDADLRTRLEICDLESWGLARELLGRLGFVCSLSELSELDLRHILKGSEHSVESRYARVAEGVGLAFSIGDSAADAIAGAAAASGLGARHLEGAVSQLAARGMGEAAASAASGVVLTVGEGRPHYEVRGIGEGDRASLAWLADLAREREAGASSALEEYGETSVICKAIDSRVRVSDIFAALDDGGQIDEASLRAVNTSPVGLQKPSDEDLYCAGVFLSVTLRLLKYRYVESCHTLGNVYLLANAALTANGRDWFAGILEESRDDASLRMDRDLYGVFAGLVVEFEAFQNMPLSRYDAVVQHVRTVLLECAFDMSAAWRMRDIVWALWGESASRADAESAVPASRKSASLGASSAEPAGRREVPPDCD